MKNNMQNINNLLLEVDEKLEDLIKLHQNLIKIQSINSGYMPTGNETEVADFCSNWLKKFEIESNIFYRDKERGNLISKYPFSGDPKP